MNKKILEFLKEDEGQTATEYILLLAVVALIIFKFKDAVQDRLTGDNGIISNVFNKADDIINQLQ